jgi:hypothetical protein
MVCSHGLKKLDWAANQVEKWAHFQNSVVAELLQWLLVS